MEIVFAQSKKDFEQAYDIVKTVFDEFVAPDYSLEGKQTFYRLVTVEFLEKLHERQGFVLNAIENDNVIGTIALRDKNHISLFFVGKANQNRGVGRALYFSAKQLVCEKKETQIHVHSSPFAVKHYMALGFTKDDNEKVEFGIRYIPMTAMP